MTEADAGPEVAAVQEPTPVASENEVLERAGPAVRRLMREHDVDSNAIRGTGRGGRITKSDVLDYIAQDSDAAGTQKYDAPTEVPSTPSAPERTERTEHTDRSERHQSLRAHQAHRAHQALQQGTVVNSAYP